MPDIDCLAGTGDVLPFVPVILALMLVVAGIAVAVARRVRGRRQSIAAAVGSVLALVLIVPLLALSSPTSASAADNCPPPPPPPTAPCEPTVAIEPPVVVSFGYTANDKVTFTLEEAWLTAFLAAGGTFDSAEFSGNASGQWEAWDVDGNVLGTQPWSYDTTTAAPAPPTVTGPTTVEIADPAAADHYSAFTDAAFDVRLVAFDAIVAQFPNDSIVETEFSLPATWSIFGSYSDGCSAQPISASGTVGGSGGGDN